MGGSWEGLGRVLGSFGVPLGAQDRILIDFRSILGPLLGPSRPQLGGLGAHSHHTIAIYDACDSHLQQLDSMQDDFLHELGLCPKKAFLDYNFAPLALRRDIAMLGLLHKRVRGIAHEQFSKLFPLSENQTRPGRHNKQLAYVRNDEMHFQQCLLHRSLFNLTLAYNRSPQNFIDIASISEFQHELTEIAKARCLAGSVWIEFYSPRNPACATF